MYLPCKMLVNLYKYLEEVSFSVPFWNKNVYGVCVVLERVSDTHNSQKIDGSIKRTRVFSKQQKLVPFKRIIQTVNLLCRSPISYHTAIKSQVTESILKLIQFMLQWFVIFNEFNKISTPFRENSNSYFWHFVRLFSNENLEACSRLICTTFLKY